MIDSPSHTPGWRMQLQVFENGTSHGNIKVDDLLTALTSYGSTKLTVDQAQELISQVLSPRDSRPADMQLFLVTMTDISCRLRLAARLMPARTRCRGKHKLRRLCEYVSVLCFWARTA